MKFCLPLLLLLAGPAFASLDESINSLVKVGSEGQGNEAASVAWKEVVKAGPDALVPILKATGQGSVLADNWLRLAANTIAAKAGKSSPVKPLEAFLRDERQNSAARVLAYDLIEQADPKLANEIEPSLLSDPAQELRRGAVQRLIEEAKAKDATKDEAGAKTVFAKAFDAARDEDQVTAVADGLEKLGEKPDIANHFGFLMKWRIIGPFDNSKREGYDTVFPPEKEIRLDASYGGKAGRVAWMAYETTNEYGKVDFNKPLGVITSTAPAPAKEEPAKEGRRKKSGGVEYLKEVTAYATTDFNSSEDRDVEIRLGCKNGWKVWLNGELLFARDEYHRGAQLDQYKLKCHMKKGKNTLLVKCCQNEQKEDWTVEWEFQLRVCDSTGTAIPQG